MFAMYFKKGEYRKMKKSKLSVGLVASFVGALAMSACSSTPAVVEKEGDLVELVDYNNGKIEIKTNDIYGKYTDSSDGTKLYYDAILEALIRYEYPELSKDTTSGLRSIDTLNAEVEDKLKSAKETANDNASNNGTTFDEEWEKILDSHDCEDDDDLKAYYLYNLEKEEISDWYAKSNIDTLKDEYLGIDKDWKIVANDKKVENVESLFPYHIIHILVKLSADKADYQRGKITEAEAKKLWSVVRNLMDPAYSFGDVAFSLSDDTSNKEYGDVGIMSTKTSFYNEFKLGVYAYDAILSGVNQEGANTAKIYQAFGLDNEATITTQTTVSSITKAKVKERIVEDMVNDVKSPVGAFTTIPTVPYQVFKLLSEHASDDKIGALAPEAGEVALPRNILFNQFLNFHSPFVITDEDIADKASNVDGTGKIVDNPADEVTTTRHNFETGDLKIQNPNFTTMTVNGVEKGVLTAKGNVIIGVRSEAGIHFMLMRKSVFEETNKQVGANTQSLQDYYTTLIPGEEGYPETGETYVNMKTTEDKTYYKNRADAIKSELKSSNFDAAYDYRLYEYLTDNTLVKDKITFTNPSVEENINEYIKLLRETKTVGDQKSINDAWQNYLLMLDYQNTVRSYQHALVPSTCAFHFNDTNSDAFKEGGVCYVISK